VGTTVFDVTAFGAVGDYDPTTGTGTDCTAAFRAAWAAARAHARRLNSDGWLGGGVGVYVPAGFYRVDVTTDLLHGGDETTPVRGLDIYGDGAHTSIVYLTGSAFFLNNDNNLGFFKFRSIGFVGVTGNERLMRMFSKGSAQAVDRLDVFTQNLAQLYDISGGATADSCSHVLCNDIQSPSTTLPFISLDNPQSIQHTFLACHAATYSLFFDVKGGGGINWYGGAIHVYPSAQHFIKIEGKLPDRTNVGVDVMNGNFSFTGLHFECEYPAGVLKSSAQAQMVFRDCDLMIMVDKAEEPRDPIGFELIEQGMLTFDHCSLALKIAITSTATTSGTEPFVQVNDCMLFRAPEDLIVLRPGVAKSGGKGKAKFTNCRGLRHSLTETFADISSADCYVNYDTGFDRHARTPNVVCLQASPENGHGLPDATGVSFSVAGGRAFVYMIKIINRAATAQVFAVKGPSGAVLAVSKPGHKYSTVMCDAEIGAPEKLSVVNLTNHSFADGYVLVFYI